MLSRRSLLAAAPTVAAAATVAPAAFAQAQQPAASAPAGSGQAPGFYRYKVGDRSPRRGTS